jgi:hypothetical protein
LEPSKPEKVSGVKVSELNHVRSSHPQSVQSLRRRRYVDADINLRAHFWRSPMAGGLAEQRWPAGLARETAFGQSFCLVRFQI